MANVEWGSPDQAKRMNYDYRERFNHIIRAVTELEEAVRHLVQRPAGGEIDRAGLNGHLKNVREAINSAGWEL